jgi:hypothetical protein
VNAIVAVGVIVGVSVGVLLGKGVNVITSPAGFVAVGVSVGVSVGALVGALVGVLAGVFVEVGPGPPGTELCPVVKLKMPSMVRALFEMIGREPSGIRFTMGL